MEKVKGESVLCDMLRQGVRRICEQDRDRRVSEVRQVRRFDGKKLKGYGAVGGGVVGVVEHVRPFLQYRVDYKVWKWVCGV